MTDDRARKQAIRLRMQETGEKYTEARRALLHGASEDKPAMWHDESFWEDVLRQAKRLGAEQGEPVARVGVYSQLQLQISLRFIPFRVRGARPIAARDIAAIEASAPLADAGYGPQIERNRRILERVAALMRDWPAAAPVRRDHSREDWRARLAAEARLRSSVAASRPTMRAKELDHEAWELGRDSYLRHPRADWFRLRRQEVDDATLHELLDAWIEDHERGYAELVAGIPAPWRGHGQLDFEALVEDAPEAGRPEAGAEWVGALPSPARVHVEKLIRGELADREEVVTDMDFVEERPVRQPEGIAALAGERWHIRGHRLSDGTIMPCRGSYRLAHSAQP